MRIIDRLRHQALIKNIPITGKDNPLLKKQLEQTQKDLNLILNKWKFGDAPIKSASEFLNNFEPWINSQLDQQKELKTFLAKNGLKNLKEIKTVNFSNEELTNFLNFHRVKSLTELEQQWKNTEQDYLKRIEELKKDQTQKEKTITGLNNSYDKLDKKFEELKKSKTASLSEEDKEKLAEYEDLISERDEAIREKRTLEQQNLALNNQLRNKQQEATNKDKVLDQLKKEKDKQEVNHQKQLKEKNGLITTLNQEIKQHKEKYSKQGKLLDTEQLECKRLEEENEKLTEEIKKMKEKGWK